MSKLIRKKELLEWFRQHRFEKWDGSWEERDEQAYQQIKEMIEKSEVTEKWFVSVLTMDNHGRISSKQKKIE